MATLLLIHDLHPVPLEQRVQAALDSVRPYMESHGGNVELLSLEHGVARIHLRGSCSDCSASSVTLELAIKHALEEAAPDLDGLEVEGVAPQMSGLACRWPSAGPSTAMELPMVMSGAGPPRRRGSTSTPSPRSRTARSPRSRRRRHLVVANVDGTLLAYRDRALPAVAAARRGAIGRRAVVPECARSFFLPRAGRSMDDDALQLEPVPLLREDGHVKVALAAMRSRAQVAAGLDDAVAARRRAALVTGRGADRSPAVRERRRAADTRALRSVRRRHPRRSPPSAALVERRIVCACEACWAMRAGEGDYRPAGNRTVWLPGLDLPDDLWASFQIPIGLAFFMDSTVTACVVAMYPSPGGATESELHFESWSRMLELNPVLEDLEPDIEGLIVNRLSDPPMYVIAPIDRCYELTGTIKARWEGISGGRGVEAAVTEFFETLRARAVPA